MNPIDLHKTAEAAAAAVSAIANAPAKAWAEAQWTALTRPWRRSGWAANLLRSLRGRSDWRDSRRHGTVVEYTLKYALRALGMPRRHARFLDFVFGHALLRACAERDPRLLERHFHPFLNRAWRRAQRLRALTGHYRCVLARLPAATAHAIYARGGLALGTLELKNGDALAVCLRPPHFLGCEGEIYIELEDARGRMLYRVAVTLIDGGATLAIGCIQGPKGEDQREAVRDVTRNLHGLRPKHLMLALARHFGACAGAQRLLAIANAAHPLRCRNGFAADYDAFWLEQGGQARADGWFELPLRTPARCETDVDSRHRAAFRRREALRARAEHLLALALGAPPHGPARRVSESAENPSAETA